MRKVLRKVKMFFRRQIHKAIVCYLKSCWGAFHHRPYGPKGIYVVMMSDRDYHLFQWRHEMLAELEFWKPKGRKP